MNERGDYIECLCGYMRYSNEPCDICAKIEAAYKRGRDDAAQAVREAAMNKRYALFNGANVLLGIYLSRESAKKVIDELDDYRAFTLPIDFEELTGNKPSELEHADDCDRTIGCTCGTRTLIGGEQE